MRQPGEGLARQERAQFGVSADDGPARDAEVAGQRVLDALLETGTSASAARNTMLPLATTDATPSNPSRSNTPRSLSLVMFLPLGAMPRRSAAYRCMGRPYRHACAVADRTPRHRRSLGSSTVRSHTSVDVGTSPLRPEHPLGLLQTVVHMAGRDRCARQPTQVEEGRNAVASDGALLTS